MHREGCIDDSLIRSPAVNAERVYIVMRWLGRSGIRMLLFALLLMTAAVLLGSGLALLHLRGTTRPSWVVGALHGLIGLVSLVALFLALQGPARGVQTGVAPFGMVAAVLAAVAFAIGLVVLLLLRARRPVAGLAIAAHATLAISAYVVLLAYVALG